LIKTLSVILLASHKFKFVTILFAAAAVGLTVGSAMADSRWYVAHWGAEPCVPVDEIGFDAHGNPVRLYYGAGAMHTPADVAGYLTALGASLSVQTESHSLVLHEERTGLYLVFYNNREWCEIEMSRVKP
jgi:hypothetical protein